MFGGILGSNCFDDTMRIAFKYSVLTRRVNEEWDGDGEKQIASDDPQSDPPSLE